MPPENPPSIQKTFAEDRFSRRDALIALVLALIVVGLSLSVSLYKRLLTPRTEAGVYTLAEVAAHDEPDDCWLIVDGIVFDLTPQSKQHPALFSCGADGSSSYHKNHGPTIRERMMQFKIGALDEASRAQLSDAAPASTTTAAIHPAAELFAPAGSWDPHDLMIVMERDNRSLLAIDGKTHTPIGRVSDIGERVHTQVFSPDGRFTYHISRDGWLTKIDLTTLQPVGSVRVGADSRGTAMTDSGKYVAVGNYEPRDVAIVDAETLDIVSRIYLFDTAGKGVSSRAGGLVEKGERFIISLKDARSVWVINTALRGMPVEQKFWDIGEEGDVLHDAFLTPEGRYFLTAVQGSDRTFVLDTEAMRKVAEVPSGKKPHTGPGATFKNIVFVPSLGEGVLTAIDMNTWTQRALIETGGAGLFVRGYSSDPTYPYVWVDTAFGEVKQDEIDVIDAEKLEVVKRLVPVSGKRAVHPEFTRDGKFVYVAVWEANQVYVYDAHTFEVVSTLDAVTPSGISNVGLRTEEPGL